MPKRKSIRHYVTNIISFANSRSKNAFKDRSSKYFAGRVTPELTQLMTDVWLPIVGFTKEIHVLRVVKSKKETSLGISVEGYTVDSGVSENGDVDAQTGPRGRLTRHFVQAVKPDGLFGRLNCLFPDDEILQVNGFRIHGRSHKEAVRCLRCLPAHIELVIARSVGGESAPTGSIAEAYAAQTEGDRDDTVVIAASEVGSVATGVSSSPAALRRAYAGDFSLDDDGVTETAQADEASSVAADGVDARSSIGSNLPNAQSPSLKVNEWMHRSQIDFSNLSSEDNARTSGSPPLSALHTEEPSTSSQRNLDTTGASVPYFTADRVTALLKLPTPSPRVVDPSDCADPSSMRWKPTWSSVPLVIILRRNTDGFGFSFTEFRGTEVAEMETGVDNATLRRTATLGRHSTFAGGISTNNSSSSNNYQTRAATLPLKGRSSSDTRSPQRSLTLRRRRNEKGHVLLIDRINPQGCVGLDGRLSVGDRLLFVNDRKVANCSLNEAATVLQHAPTGYTMVGVAKMKMVCVPITQTLSAPLFGSAGLSLSRSMGGMDQQSMSPSLSNTGQDEFVKEYKNDHPLDYYSHFVVSPDSEYLHAPNVSAPPMPQEEELVVRIKANSFPLGIKLDASAAGGIDGCRVVQVLRGGAVEHSASLAPGDYITRINSDSLRQVTNVEAFRIVRRASVDCPTVEIAYFPSSKISEHRANYVVATDLLTNGKETAVSLANCSTSVGSLIGSLQDEVVSTNTVDLLLTTEPLPFPSDVLDAGPWQQTREIKLLKLPGESGWGLKLTGPELWDSSFTLQSLPLPPGISRPCFVSEVIAKSPADRCGLIEPGDIIVGINGLDASCAGCRGVAEWIYSANLATATTAVATTNTSSSSTFPPSDGEFLSSASSLSNAVALDNDSVILYLLTLPLNSLPAETLNRLTAPLLLNDVTPQSSDHKPDAKCIPSVVLPSPVLSPTVLLDNHENHNEASEPASVGFAQPSSYAIQSALLSSDESSFMEEPSSVTTLDVHQDLSVPQPLAFTGLSISAPQAASQPTSETERESSPATERPLPSPPPASRSPLPAPPATSSGIMSSYTDGGSDSDVLPAVQSLESQSAWRNIGSQLSDSWAALPEKYRRPTLPDDEIRIVSLVIKPTSPSPTPDRPSRVDCDTLGIRLVGHKDVNNRGVFICGIREGSLAAATGGLLVSDEIVQVNNICVLGLTHLSAQLLISKEAESVRRLFSVGEDNSQANTLSIIVRRNPTYNYSVMAKPSNLASHFPSCPPGPTKTPSSAVESEIKESTSSVFHSSPLRPAHEVSRPPPTKKSVNVEFVDVVIERNQSGFGLCLVNMNNAHEIGVFVQSVDPNSPAGQSGKIANWDRIIAVNGQLIDEYDTALQLLTRCPNRVSLRVSRIKPAHSLQPIVEGQSTAPLPKAFSPLNAPPTPVVPGVETTIELLKGTGDLGFSIVGGTDTVHGSVFVHEVYEGGLVARDGRLKPGDRLLAVNNIDLRKATHATARNAIRSTGEVARLTVLRQAGAASPDQDYQQTYSVRLEKSPDQTYGLVLIDTTPYQGTTVGDILRGSPALRTALIQPGDVILEVNDRDVHCLSSDEVVAVLRQFPTSVVLKFGRPKQAQTGRDARLRLFTVLLTRSPTRTSAPNLAETFSATVPNAFGVILREATEADWSVAPGNLIIADILPNSPAYRSGMLQVGDRLLGIDREPVDWLQIEELYAFVAAFESLTFEFGRLPPMVLAPADLLPLHSDPAADFPLLPALPPCENSLAPLVEYVPPPSAPEQPAFSPQTSALQVEEARDEEDEEEDYEDNDVLGTRVQVRQLHLPFVETPPPDVADGWLHDAASAAHRPRLGLSVVSAHGACGPKVSAVAPDSPAEAAGLRVGDRLLGLDDHLLVALGGQNVEKVLAVVEERWLSRPPRDERGQANSQVMLTVITTAPQPPPRATRRASAEMLNGLHAEDFGALPGGFYPPDSSHRILRAPPAMHMGPRAPPRRWPKDVGDNLDVNLQAAPPGLISAFGQAQIAVGAWETDAAPARPEAFHLPGDRDPGTVSDSYYYPHEDDARYDDRHYAEHDEPDSANDHEPPALENDLRENTSDQHAFT